MKFVISFLLLALVTVASCQDLTADEVIDIIQENNPDLNCIGLQCRLGCVESGSKSGYCKNDACVCVPTIYT